MQGKAAKLTILDRTQAILMLAFGKARNYKEPLAVVPCLQECSLRRRSQKHLRTQMARHSQIPRNRCTDAHVAHATLRRPEASDPQVLTVAMALVLSTLLALPAPRDL